MNLSWHKTNQVWVSSRLTYFYRSYWPFAKIWCMNLSWHKTNQVWVSSRLTYFYRSYYPLLKFCFLFSGLFSAIFWDIQLKFCIWIAFVSIQTKFKFRHGLPSFTGVNALCKNLFFPNFSLIFWFITWNYFWALLICCFSLNNIYFIIIRHIRNALQ